MKVTIQIKELNGRRSVRATAKDGDLVSIIEEPVITVPNSQLRDQAAHMRQRLAANMDLIRPILEGGDDAQRA